MVYFLKGMSRLINPCRRRAAVMTIRNVEKRNLRELFRDKTDARRVADVPGRVTHAVFGGKVHSRPF